MDNKKSWGGKRKGAGSGGSRPNAGRKKTRFSFGKIGDSFVIERGMLGEMPSRPEVWEVAQVTEGYFELQRTVGGTSEIITISKLSFWNGDDD